MSQRKKQKPTGLANTIRENPSSREIDDTVKNVETLKQSMPIVEPLFEMLGVDIGEVKKALEKFDFQGIDEMLDIPDRFNELFVEHGWIIYSTMSLTVAKEAIKKAEVGDFVGAEGDLIDYYNEKNIRMQLTYFDKIKAFKPRMRLINLALDDYLAERYHAIIPVVLALTDGLVNELHPDRRGISAEKTELQAWDSIAAHSQGLGKLKSILFKGRKKINTESITLPYRNGILHGTDLGYDNITVAAKTWALLFAVGEWATKVEKGELEAPDEEPPVTIHELLVRSQQTEQLNNELDNWVARELISLDPEKFTVGTPEYVLNAFLNYWVKKNYGKMAEILPPSKSEIKPPLRIKKHFQERLLKSFKFNSIDDVGLANTTIQVRLEIEKRGRVEEKDCRFIMLTQDEKGDTVSRTNESARWVSNDWRVF